MAAKNNGLPNNIVEMTLSGVYDTNELVVIDDINFSRDMPPTPSTVNVSVYFYNVGDTQKVTVNSFLAGCSLFLSYGGLLSGDVSVGKNIEDLNWTDEVDYGILSDLTISLILFYSNGSNTVRLVVESDNGEVDFITTRLLDDGSNSWYVEESFSWNSSHFLILSITIEIL